MSRMNNQSRSLKIISRQSGGDPDAIEGGGTVAPVYHERERPYDSDTGPIPGAASDPQRSPANGTTTVTDIPVDTRGGPRHPSGSDPAPGMPGA